MKKKNAQNICKRHADCFANRTGKCLVLTETDFGKKECPFYKTKEELDEQRRRIEVKH